MQTRVRTQEQENDAAAHTDDALVQTEDDAIAQSEADEMVALAEGDQAQGNADATATAAFETEGN
ncbi:MAG TPA: hypothetical protein VFI31_05835 [Pirellulales bacterium]|nr:hypothetical protein [Pirellulales bacterium]